MSTTITAKCVDQNLKIVSAPDIASGGVNEDTLVVEFCPLWEGYDKTAVFYRTKDEVYHAPLDEEGKCTIPWEVMQTPGYLYLGVFGCKDDITRTSLVARYAVKPGAITEETRPSEPTPNIYEQILSKFIPKGGSKGQVLRKKSDKVHDMEWGEGGGDDYQPADFVVTVDANNMADKTGAEVYEALGQGRRVYLVDFYSLRYEYVSTGYDYFEFNRYDSNYLHGAQLPNWDQQVYFYETPLGQGEVNNIFVGDESTPVGNFYSRFRHNKMPVIAMTSYGVAYMTGYTDRTHLCFTVLPDGTNDTKAPMKLISYSSSDGWQLIGEVGGDSKLFIGNDDTTYDEWLNYVDNGYVCVWKRHGLGDHYFHSKLNNGDLTFVSTINNLSTSLHLSPDGNITSFSYTMPRQLSVGYEGKVFMIKNGSAGWHDFEVGIDLSGYALKNDVPQTLPNPNALIISSLLERKKYDGTAEVEITIPQKLMCGLMQTDGVWQIATLDGGSVLTPEVFEMLWVNGAILEVLDVETGELYPFDGISVDTGAVIFARQDGTTRKEAALQADGTVTVAESEFAYSKAQIDTALGSDITDIDNLIGGDS